MRRRLSTAAAGAVAISVALSLGASAGAREASVYVITVALDETSIGDLRILDNTLNDAIDGEEVSSSVRKVAMGAVGEVWGALNDRIDDNGMLTLDDGSQVFLLDEDGVEVQAQGKKFKPGATITFHMVCSKMTGQCHRVPAYISVLRGDGTKLCSAFPPKQLGTPDGEKPVCKLVKSPLLP
jgi:hypothetical protein